VVPAPPQAARNNVVEQQAGLNVSSNASILRVWYVLEIVLKHLML
jgi:hypothetical protein